MKFLPILFVFGIMMSVTQAGTGAGFAPRQHDLSRHHWHHRGWTIHQHSNPVHMSNPMHISSPTPPAPPANPL